MPVDEIVAVGKYSATVARSVSLRVAGQLRFSKADGRLWSAERRLSAKKDIDPRIGHRKRANINAELSVIGQDAVNYSDVYCSAGLVIGVYFKPGAFMFTQNRSAKRVRRDAAGGP